MPIHPTAIVHPAARVAESAEIGPCCIVGAEVEIGERTRLIAHLYLDGPMLIGADNVFYPYSTVGVASQDLKYRGERSEARIGDHNTIREFVTIHRGTEGGGLLTSIGSHNLLMAYVHVAHDARIGDHTVLANGVTCGGVPGLSLGAAISSGNAVKVQVPPNAPIAGDQRVTLWEAHARWTPAKFDLSAVYAHGSISNLSVANASNPGSPQPIPSEFYGYFAQVACGLWEQGDYRLAPFVRWERYDLGSRYAGTLGPMVSGGLVPLSKTPGDYGYWPRIQDRVWTVGANFYTTPHVVFKADYQWFDLNRDFNRFDLGLGLNF